jgi:hypothetical protein
MLLRRIHFCGKTPIELYEWLVVSASATLVSDDSADHLQGSAGWVIAVHDDRVVTGTFPVPGYDPHSYRAKGYGMLSGLLFH